MQPSTNRFRFALDALDRARRAVRKDVAPASPTGAELCRRLRPLGRLVLVVVIVAASSVAAQEAQEGSAPKSGTQPTEADYDMLRKLLGVEAPPVRPQAAPAREVPRDAPAPMPEPVAAPAASRAFEATRRKAALGPSRRSPKTTVAPTSDTEQPLPTLQEPATIEEADQKVDAAPGNEAEAPAPTFLSSDVPPPGSIVDTSSLDRWQDFISPSIQWVVRRGARLNVVANEPLPMEPARAEATQRYSPQVRLSADKTHLVNYVAGVPFPFVQTDDPDAGIKMILNWDGRIANDDLDIRNFACQTGSIGSRGIDGADSGLDVEKDYIFGHFRRLYYVSRLYNEPKPTWNNPDGIRYREMLHPVLEPFDLKGAGFTYNRFQDAGRQDDSWLYLPQTKRVRRLSTAQRSEGLFGQDIDLDSYGGYGGNPSWTDWRLLGTKTILATMHGRTMPAKWLPAPNDFLFDDAWEPRDVWVLEGRSKLPGYAFGSRVIYIDRESFIIPYTEIFDLEGRLWKGLVQNWQTRRKMRPDSKYDPGYEHVVISGVSLFDMQEGHATRCQYPAREFTEEDGWYVNVGDEEGTTEEAFDVARFIGEGR